MKLSDLRKLVNDLSHLSDDVVLVTHEDHRLCDVEMSIESAFRDDKNKWSGCNTDEEVLVVLISA